MCLFANTCESLFASHLRVCSYLQKSGSVLVEIMFFFFIDIFIKILRFKIIISTIKLFNEIHPYFHFGPLNSVNTSYHNGRDLQVERTPKIRCVRGKQFKFTR